MSTVRGFLSGFGGVLVGVDVTTFLVAAVVMSLIGPVTLTTIVTVPSLAVSIVNIAMTLIIVARS